MKQGSFRHFLSGGGINWGSFLVAIFFFSFIILMLLADLSYTSFAESKEMFSSSELRHAFFLSLFTSIISMGIGLLVAIPIGYFLSQAPLKTKVIADVLVDLLIVLPVIVTGLSILVFFRNGRLLMDSEFFLFHWIGVLFTGINNFFVYQIPGIILAQFLCSVSFAIRAIKASFDRVDQRKVAVAMTLGCSRTSAFFKVMIPEAGSGIAAGAVLAWARAFGIFGAVSVVAGTVRGRTEVLPSSIYLEISNGNLEQALSLSLLMVVVAFFFLLLLRFIFRSDIMGFGSGGGDK